MSHTRGSAFALMTLSDDVLDVIEDLKDVENAEYGPNEDGEILITTSDGRHYTLTVESA